VTRPLRVPATLIALLLVVLAGCGETKEAARGESISSAASLTTPAVSAPAPVATPVAAPAQPTAPVAAPAQPAVETAVPTQPPVEKPVAPPQEQPVATVTSTAERLKFSELYKGASITEGLVLSDKVQALKGQRVAMVGYMAPPLKASLNYFVLTKVPMSICPFCSTDADWPDDIILVLIDKPMEALPYTEPIEVTGIFEVGGLTDEESGFYSILRIRAESVKVVK